MLLGAGARGFSERDGGKILPAMRHRPPVTPGRLPANPLSALEKVGKRG